MTVSFRRYYCVDSCHKVLNGKKYRWIESVPQKSGCTRDDRSYWDSAFDTLTTTNSPLPGHVGVTDGQEVVLCCAKEKSFGGRFRDRVMMDVEITEWRSFCCRNDVRTRHRTNRLHDSHPFLAKGRFTGRMRFISLNTLDSLATVVSHRNTQQKHNPNIHPQKALAVLDRLNSSNPAYCNFT